jgi:AraC-like DNA-binding protein
MERKNRAPTYTVPIRSACNVIATASSRLSPRELCGAVGLDPELLSDPHSRMPMSQLVALYETTAALTKDPAFGLHVGMQTSLRAFSVFGYLVINSATVGLALERAVHYFPSWTDGASFSSQRESSALHLIWQYAKMSPVDCRHDCEMTLLSAAKVSQLSGIRDWQPREVHFQHAAPKDISEHKRLFRAPVYFRMPHNQVIFDRATLVAPIPDADPVLCEILISQAEHLLATGPSKSSLLDRVKFALRESLSDGEIGLAALARRIGIGARTLQRKLKEHGTSFTELLSCRRLELAEQSLRDADLSIGEISYLLDYSSPSQFHRAFKRWTGIAPKQYRLSRNQGSMKN